MLTRVLRALLITASLTSGTGAHAIEDELVLISGVRSCYDVEVISVYDDELAQRRYEQVNATFRREIEPSPKR